MKETFEKETFEMDQFILEALEAAADERGLEYLRRTIYFRLTRPKFRQSGSQANLFIAFRMAAARIERENGLGAGSIMEATRQMLKRAS